MGLFGEKSNPREQLRKMVSVIRRQKYSIQRDINALQSQNKRVTADIKKRAKEGRIDEAKILARELINSRKAVSRLYAANAHMDSIISELNCQAATTRLASSIQSSTAVMKSMSALIKLPDLQKTMQELSKEMMKMGIIGEMVDDTMESALGDTDDMEEAVSAEVNKILAEITATEMEKVPEPGQDSLPTDIFVPGGRLAADSIEDDGEITQMQERLAALKN